MEEKLKSAMEQLWKKRRSENLVARSTVEGRKAGSLARVIDLALVCAPGQRNLHTEGEMNPHSVQNQKFLIFCISSPCTLLHDLLAGHHGSQQNK